MADSKMPMNCPPGDKAAMAASGKGSGACSGGTPAPVQMGKGK